MLTTSTTTVNVGTSKFNTLPYMNIKGYVGFSDPSGSSAGTVPRALIEIQSTGGYNAQASYIPYNPTASAAITAMTTTPYSLYTAGSILCGTEIDIASDRRIKTNILDVLDASALDVLRQLKPKRYNYIDVITRSPAPVWGYIAQDVASVLDYAVKTTTDFIPNIYRVVSVNGNTISLTTPSKSTDTIMLTLVENALDVSGSTDIVRATDPVDVSGQEPTTPMVITTGSFIPNTDGSAIRIKIYDSNYVARYTTIVSIIDEFTFTVEDTFPDTEMFIFGQEVSDFHVLDKMAIYTVATAALQELDVEHQNTQNQVATLQQQNAELTDTVTTLQTQMAAILQRLENANI